MDAVIRRTVPVFIGLCIAVVTVFAGIRLVQDVPTLVGGEMPPPDSFERRYAEHPVLAYAHIVPGLVYLGLAPFQVASRFRRGRLRRHRRLGRIALVAGVSTGAFAIAVGIVFPFGGMAETTASTLFGVSFLASLALAFRAIRGGDVDAHRRWMIRAFAVGTGVGTIRLVIGFAQAAGLAFDAVFGPAFWVAFLLHAAAAELWLARYPTAREAGSESRALRSVG